MASRLTAMDVENEDFSRKLRGYDPAEVRLFLKSVSEEVERLNLDNARVHEEMGALRKDLEEIRTREKTLQQTLVTAQSMAEEMKERALRESELIVKQARVSADRLLQDARSELGRVESDISRAKLDRESVEHRLRSAIEQHLELLDMRKQARRDNVRMMPHRTGIEAG